MIKIIKVVFYLIFLYSSNSSIISCNDNKECEEFVNIHIINILSWNDQTNLSLYEINFYKTYYIDLYNKINLNPDFNLTLIASSLSKTPIYSPTIVPSLSFTSKPIMTLCLRGNK